MAESYSTRATKTSSSGLTAEHLRTLLRYEPETGKFFNLVRRGSRSPVGSEAGYLSPNGYVFIGVDRVLYRAHRLAWLYMFGAWPENEIDHINQIKDDNRLSNLRDVTALVNASNKSKPTTRNAIGVRGVHKQGGLYIAALSRGGKRKTLGMHKTIEEAAMAYQAARDAAGIGPMPQHAGR